jgi:hypothetical protein
MTDDRPRRGRTVERDPGRFSRFHPEGRAVIPPDAEGTLDWKPTCVLIAERHAAMHAAERARETSAP